MYNVEDYAKKCIESILVQSFRDFELIIVNDGSKDGTSKIINYYKNINNVVVIHKENG
jgi:glycosyltransferase involved in cell wall biosynthesis